MLATNLIDSNWKMPPIAKIYEALSAVADSRVRLVGPQKAEVDSSSKDKTYIVEWSADGKEIISNDNASYWQGYIGYPIVAVLITTERIPCDPQLTSLLVGVHWNKINKQHKNKYDQAVASVLDALEAEGKKTEPLVVAVKSIYSSLQNLGLKKLTGRRRPPSGK